MALFRRHITLLLLIALGLGSYLVLRPSTDTLVIDSPPIQISNSTTSILLVSALYPLAKSKHTSVDYARWLSLFLGQIQADVYFFTTPEMASLVRDVAVVHSRSITINTTYSSPYDIPPLLGLRGQYEQMHALDRERARHSPELYAVWNAKPFFLSEAVRNTADAGYHYAFWCDAGSFRREHRYAVWPDPDRVDELWREAGEDMLFLPIESAPGPAYRGWKADMGPVDVDFSEGSFFGGRPRVIEWWRETYYAYHDAYLERGIFVGKDQTLMNAILMVHGTRVFTVWSSDPDAPAHSAMPSSKQRMLGECSDSWFYYQFWLAGAREKELMRGLWNTRNGVWFWWYVWGVWQRLTGRERVHGVVQACRQTRPLLIDNVLRRAFGDEWIIPEGLIL